MNRVLATLALLSSVALAQGPAGATPATAPLASEDRALLNAILGAFAPAPEEVRVIAIEDLGLLGDPRGLDVLAALLHERSPRLKVAVLRAARAFRHPRAEQLLIGVVRDRGADERLKLDALEALAFQGTADARAFLARVRDDAAYGPRLQATARAVLQRLAAR